MGSFDRWRERARRLLLEVEQDAAEPHRVEQTLREALAMFDAHHELSEEVKRWHRYGSDERLVEALNDFELRESVKHG